METRMIGGKPCLLEKSLIKESGLTAAVFSHVTKNSQVAYYDRKDGRWYPLSSVLIVMSAAAFPKPDYNRMAQVATEMLDRTSPAKEKLDEIEAILLREAPAKKKPAAHKEDKEDKAAQVPDTAEPAAENVIMQQDAAKLLGLSPAQLSALRKKKPDIFPDNRGPHGSWIYSEEDIERIRPEAEDVLRRSREREERTNNTYHVYHNYSSDITVFESGASLEVRSWQFIKITS